MYESFFGFSERPFSLTPNTKFFYLSEHHEEVLRTLLYGIEHRVGFMMLSGEVGAGKTTTIRALLNLIQGRVETSLILNPLLSTLDLITSINRDFGNEVESESLQHQIESLNKYLLSVNAEGRTAVVVIDEAQNLSFEAFEITRMLSNLETESEKLINIIFVGQPELVTAVNDRKLRQLAQRIQVHVNLSPLDLRETGDYISHRLQNAGNAKTTTHTTGANGTVSKGAPVSAFFESDAIKQIFKKSKGIPRVINTICEMGLLAAFCNNTHIIDKKIIKQALKEVPSYVYHT